MSIHKEKAWKARGLLEVAPYLKGVESLTDIQKKKDKHVCAKCGKNVRVAMYEMMGDWLCESCHFKD